MLHVIEPGLQTTLQGAPRRGHRHFGVAYSGPADPLSMALANRLVGNAGEATGLEITYGGFSAEARSPCSIALTGAHGGVSVNEVPASDHRTLHLSRGDQLQVRAPTSGTRCYLAIRGGFDAAVYLGSSSTYLPAGFGGLDGRSLQLGDDLIAPHAGPWDRQIETPHALRPVFLNAFALRACPSAETDTLPSKDVEMLFREKYTLGRQTSRMGVFLKGHPMQPRSDGMMKSVPVFPGTIQCPPSGDPIILLCDAQTTGGYPRIAHIARCDRHLLGQLRPGNSVRLIKRTPNAAVQDLRAKNALFQPWLGFDPI